MRDDLGRTTWPDKVRAERDKYGEFIERLARTGLKWRLDNPSYWYCPHCDGGVVRSGIGLTHEGNCPVVEARRLLGWPVDERGNLE